MEFCCQINLRWILYKVVYLTYKQITKKQKTIKPFPFTPLPPPSPPPPPPPNHHHPSSDSTDRFNVQCGSSVSVILCSCAVTCSFIGRPRWLSGMRRPTGDQEVAGSTPAEVGNILSWRLIMKYFLRSFTPFRWFKKGSCQFLAKECAQYWITA